VRRWTRPDGRCFVFGEPDDDLPGGDLYATVDASDAEKLRWLEDLGFTLHRRELVLQLPTDTRVSRLAEAAPPDGIALVRADAVEERRLRLLDDDLRQEVPGTDGWHWDEDGFHAETYESPDYDPATYLVAVAAGGEYVGIARVWMKPELPRLGFIGVRREHRRRGLARALLAAVFAVLHERGVQLVTTEVDERNVASRTLLEAAGGEVVGASLELVRRRDLP
jgi:RimJ/RimL family protein N-acetyltransferase